MKILTHQEKISTIYFIIYCVLTKMKKMCKKELNQKIKDKTKFLCTNNLKKSFHILRTEDEMDLSENIHQLPRT